MNYLTLAERVLNSGNISRAEALDFLQDSDENFLEMLSGAYIIRKRYYKKKITIQLLKNAKSGNCTENCSYCSQSTVSEAAIDKYALMNADELSDGAENAREINAKRYCMALSGGFVSDSEIDMLCDSLRKIRKSGKIDTCCSLGFITVAQAKRLKAAGLDRVNHNLNTSADYYEKICTSHTYKERVANIKRCREAGLEICSGGIIGQGESDIDIVNFLFELKEIKPNSIPLNFFIPIKGTPFGSNKVNLNPRKCLKILALLRFVHPEADLRLAGGREYHLKSFQVMALYAINSIFVRGYLTTGGDGEDEAISMIKDAGFEIEVDGCE